MESVIAAIDAIFPPCINAEFHDSKDKKKYSLFRYETLRNNPADIFVASLSCADFLSGFTGLTGLVTFLCEYDVSVWIKSLCVDVILRHVSIEANLYG